MIMYLSPSLIMLVVFGVFSLNNGTMDISLVLTILAFLNSVRFPMMVIPFAAQAIAEAMNPRSGGKPWRWKNCPISLAMGMEANCRVVVALLWAPRVSYWKKMRMMTKIVDKKLLLE